VRCNEVKRSLSAYFDGELSEDKMLKIKEHLKYCNSCASELRKIERIHGLMESFPVLETGPYFEAQVIEKIERETRRKRYHLGLKLAIGFALGGILLFLVTFKYQPGQNEPAQSYASLDTYLQEYIETSGRHMAGSNPGLITTISSIGETNR